MEVERLKREFVVDINGKKKTISDPNPDFTLDEVQKFLSVTYPEITNGSIGTPDIKNDVQIFSISKFAGTKG